MLRAVYPGTFDPITYGHRDVIERAVKKLCSRLIIGVTDNTQKIPLFDCAERVALIEADIAEMGLQHLIEVRPFTGLLTNFVRAVGADILVRGLRAVSDFEYEFQMATANHRLDCEIETVFLMASERHHFTASSVVREVALHGGDAGHFVSETVAVALRAKIARMREQT